MSIGFWELFIIFIAAALIIKPEKADLYAKSIAKFIKKVKTIEDETKESLDKEAPCT